jgi:hypothetical protein
LFYYLKTALNLHYTQANFRIHFDTWKLGKRKRNGAVELVPKCIKIQFVPHKECIVLVFARLIG